MEEIKKCVKQAKVILSKELGVMDVTGLIIAATEPELEETVDMSARAVLKSTDLFSCTSDKTYMKVIVGDQAKFIAYMEGIDQQTRTYLELISEWIKTASKAKGTDAERQMFTKNVLLENELPGDIPLKAREYGIECSVPRLVLVARTSKEQGADALEILQNFYPDESVASIFAMDEATAIVVMNAKDAVQNEDTKNDFILTTSQSIVECLGNESISVYVGVGSFVASYQYLAKSYRDAMLALRVGKVFGKNSYVSRYDMLGLGRLIYQLPATLCHMFIEEVFPSEAYATLDEDTLDTIECFFKNNLNGSETARELYVHRNTLVYRLDKVKKNTGLDLRSFDDAVLFKMASMVRTYLEYLDSGKDGNQIR